jgi:PBSX family phage terminase large subunit
MSLLANIAGGNCLEKPASAGTRCEETYGSLRDRILASLLPTQRDFCLDTEHKILGFCAGFGAGKTRSLCAKAILLAMENPNTAGAVFEPTNILLRDVWLRSFDDFLEEFDIPFQFRVSPQPEYIIHHPTGTTVLLCRATETWNRIRGLNLSFVLADEIDTSPPEVAQKAAEMMLARLRGGTKPQLALASTPEGFKFMYRTFVQDFHDAESSDDPTALPRIHAERRLIKAKTTDNPYLPAGFVDSLYANYPPQLIASYIEGEFTNLANTNVYPYFDRDLHWCDTAPTDDDRLFIGIDFNVGACFLEVLVRRNDEFHFIAEHTAKDTPALVRLIQSTYPTQIEAGNLVVIPDAASRQRSTTNAAESDLALLRRGGFTVKSQSSNPAIEDRVNALNTLFISKRLRISNRCKYLIRSLETQAYDTTGKPEKGRGGLDDKSGPVDAAGYAVHALAGLRRYASGGSAYAVY